MQRRTSSAFLQNVLGLDRVQHSAQRTEVNRLDRFSVFAHFDRECVFTKILAVDAATGTLHFEPRGLSQ